MPIDSDWRHRKPFLVFRQLSPTIPTKTIRHFSVKILTFFPLEAYERETPNISTYNAM